MSNLNTVVFNPAINRKSPVSASYALTASVAITPQVSGSWASSSLSASHALFLLTSDNQDNVEYGVTFIDISHSMHVDDGDFRYNPFTNTLTVINITASLFGTASYAISASYAPMPLVSNSSSWASSSVSSSYTNYALSGLSASWASQSLSASYLKNSNVTIDGGGNITSVGEIRFGGIAAAPGFMLKNGSSATLYANDELQMRGAYLTFMPTSSTDTLPAAIGSERRIYADNNGTWIFDSLDSYGIKFLNAASYSFDSYIDIVPNARLRGTASWAVSASWAPSAEAVSSTSASWASSSISSSYADYALNSLSASWASSSISSSYAETASYAMTGVQNIWPLVSSSVMTQSVDFNVPYTMITGSDEGNSNLWFSSSVNKQAVTNAVIYVPASISRDLFWNTSWKYLTISPPSNMTENESLIASFTCFGPNEEDIIASVALTV